jgi:hypothetical protein
VDIYFASRMADQGRGWLYGGWKESGAHISEWMNKTQVFLVVHSLDDLMRV